MSDPRSMLKSMKRARRQTAMKFKYRGRGGYREGAGRPKKPGAGVSHRTRQELLARHPVHVTVRVRVDAARRGVRLHPEAVDPMSSEWERGVVVEPRTWLLRWGWLRVRPAG